MQFVTYAHALLFLVEGSHVVVHHAWLQKMNNMPDSNAF